MRKLIFKSSDEYMLEVAGRIKETRKVLKYSREKLSIISGVPTSTIRRFENTGEISFRSLVDILTALNFNDDIDQIAANIPYKNIKDLIKND